MGKMLKIICLDGFDYEWIEKVNYLKELKCVKAKVRCLPSINLIPLILSLTQKVEFIHKKEIDEYAHHYPEKLEESIKRLDKKLRELVTGNCIIVSDHGNKKLSKTDFSITGLTYGHDFFVTYGILFWITDKQEPKDLGEISMVECERLIKKIVEYEDEEDK